MAWRRSTSTDRPKIPRWQKAAALIPLALFVLAVVLGWTLFVDRLIKLGIEAGGTAAVGARGVPDRRATN